MPASAGWIAEHDAGAAGGAQLGAQRFGTGAAALRDAGDVFGGATAREIGAQHQRQTVVQNGVVLAPQALVGGEDLSLRPVAGELHPPRAPCRTRGASR